MDNVEVRLERRTYANLTAILKRNLKISNLVMEFTILKTAVKLAVIILLITPIYCYELTTELNTTMVNLLANDGFYFENPFLNLYDQNTEYPADYLSQHNYETSSPVTEKLVKNLYSTLKQFSNSKCLIAINNFLNADIQPTNLVPVFFRRFGLAIVHITDHPGGFLRNQIIWTPKEYLSKLDGNYTVKDPIRNPHNCHLSQYYTPSFFSSFNNHGYCVGLNPDIFSSNSKPWLCEVQVDLFIPKKTILLGKHTQIFRCTHWNRFDISSNMPEINILVDSAKTLKGYDSATVVNWMSRQRKILGPFTADGSDFEPSTDLTIFAYVSCVEATNRIIENGICQILNLSILFPCVNCKNTYMEYKLRIENLKIEFIKFLDETYKHLLSTSYMDSPTLAGDSLAGQISIFIQTEPAALILPLKNFHKIQSRYPDKIQMLAFAYASVFKDLLGNVTRISNTVFEKHHKHSYLRVFIPVLSEDTFKEQIRVEFKFGQLHIVSCGSRGIEPISLLQIVTVFETRIWIILFAFIVLLLLSGNHLVGRSHYSSLLSIFKVLVEQSGPFPENNAIVNKLKLISCGSLLAGLVISNAFKSENVYNIVTPRQQISYYTLSELVEDNFKIFSRITKFEFEKWGWGWNTQLNDKNNILLFYNDWKVFGGTEVLSVKADVYRPTQNDDLEKCEMHPDTKTIFLESLALLDPLSRSKMLDWQIPNTPDTKMEANTLKLRVWSNQNELILHDMYQCNKTAWILPNYLAQDISRKLIKAANHSDVGTFAYSNPFLYLHFYGLFPLSILNQFSKILNTGIVEWWPNFINRTDLIRKREKLPPSKPNMNGHTQVIFILLGAGLLTAISSLVVELSGMIFKYTNKLYKFNILLFKYYKRKIRVKLGL